ncbi:MAG: HEAT repeat domain-containing protein, partial [Candidatus Omnitrophica bacterium]|nr:HEAT repeat domain-containing protein [Candidatus Omnitrophota bacterium]
SDSLRTAEDLRQHILDNREGYYESEEDRALRIEDVTPELITEMLEVPIEEFDNLPPSEKVAYLRDLVNIMRVICSPIAIYSEIQIYNVHAERAVKEICCEGDRKIFQTNHIYREMAGVVENLEGEAKERVRLVDLLKAKRAPERRDPPKPGTRMPAMFIGMGSIGVLSVFAVAVLFAWRWFSARRSSKPAMLDRTISGRRRSILPSRLLISVMTLLSLLPFFGRFAAGAEGNELSYFDSNTGIYYRVVRVRKGKIELPKVEPLSREEVLALLEQMGTKPSEINWSVVGRLSRGGDSAVDVLAGLLEPGHDLMTRSRASYLLRYINFVNIGDASKARVLTVFEKILLREDENNRLKLDAAAALARFSDDGVCKKQAVDALLAALQNGAKGKLRSAIVAALGDMKDSRAVGALVRLLKEGVKKEEVDLPKTLRETLTKFGDEAVSGLRVAFETAGRDGTDPKVCKDLRSYIIHYLSDMIENRSAFEFIRSIAEDVSQDPDLRGGATEALAYFQFKEVDAVLVGMSKEKLRPDLKESVIKGLGGRSSMVSVDALIGFLRDPSVGVAKEAASRLSDWGIRNAPHQVREKAIEVLADLMEFETKDHWNWAEACDSLASLCNRSHIGVKADKPISKKARQRAIRALVFAFTHKPHACISEYSLSGLLNLGEVDTAFNVATTLLRSLNADKRFPEKCGYAQEDAFDAVTTAVNKLLELEIIQKHPKRSRVLIDQLLIFAQKYKLPEDLSYYITGGYCEALPFIQSKDVRVKTASYVVHTIALYEDDKSRRDLAESLVETCYLDEPIKGIKRVRKEVSESIDKLLTQKREGKMPGEAELRDIQKRLQSDTEPQKAPVVMPVTYLAMGTALSEIVVLLIAVFFAWQWLRARGARRQKEIQQVPGFEEPIFAGLPEEPADEALLEALDEVPEVESAEERGPQRPQLPEMPFGSAQRIEPVPAPALPLDYLGGVPVYGEEGHTVMFGENGQEVRSRSVALGNAAPDGREMMHELYFKPEGPAIVQLADSREVIIWCDDSKKEVHVS